MGYVWHTPGGIRETGCMAFYAVHIALAYKHPRKSCQPVTEQAGGLKTGPIPTVTSGYGPGESDEREARQNVRPASCSAVERDQG